MIVDNDQEAKDYLERYEIVTKYEKVRVNPSFVKIK